MEKVAWIKNNLHSGILCWLNCSETAYNLAQCWAAIKQPTTSSNLSCSVVSAQFCILFYTFCSEHLRNNQFFFFPPLWRYHCILTWETLWEICMAEQLLSVTFPISVHTFSESPHIFQSMFSLKCPQLEVMSYSKEFLILLHPPPWKPWCWSSFLNPIPIELSLHSRLWSHLHIQLCQDPGPSHCDLLQTLPHRHRFVMWQVSSGCVGLASGLLFVCPVQPCSQTNSCFCFRQGTEDRHLLPWFHHVGYLVNWQQL